MTADCVIVEHKHWIPQIKPYLGLIVAALAAWPASALSLDDEEIAEAGAIVDAIGVIRFAQDCAEETVGNQKFCWGTLREETATTLEAEAREDISREALRALGKARGRTIGAIARGATFVAKKGIPVAGQVMTAWEVGTTVGDLVSENVIAPAQKEYYRKKQVAEDRKALRVTELLKGDKELAKEYSKMLLDGRRKEAEELLDKRLAEPPAAVRSGVADAGGEQSREAHGRDDEITAARHGCPLTEEDVRAMAAAGDDIGGACERLAMLVGLVDTSRTLAGGTSTPNRRAPAEEDLVGVRKADGTPPLSAGEQGQSNSTRTSNLVLGEPGCRAGGCADEADDPRVLDRRKDALLAMVIGDIKGRAVERANMAEESRKGVWGEAYKTSQTIVSQVDVNADDQVLVEQIQRVNARQSEVELVPDSRADYGDRRGREDASRTTNAPAQSRESSGACDQFIGDEATSGRISEIQLEICADLMERFSHFDTDESSMGNCEIYNQALSIYRSRISADRICVQRVAAAGVLRASELACLRESSSLNTQGVEAAIQQTREGMESIGCGEERTVDLFAGQE